MSQQPASPITIRTDLRPGDIGALTQLHGLLYSSEFGFDYTFEAYVAASLAEFGLHNRPERERIWLVEQNDELMGSIGIVDAGDRLAQLRWVVLDAAVRGNGIGHNLLEQAINFARETGYRTIYLWTVHTLTAAAALYRSHGFVLTEEKPVADLWSQRLVEQRYDLDL